MKRKNNDSKTQKRLCVMVKTKKATSIKKAKTNKVCIGNSTSGNETQENIGFFTMGGSLGLFDIKCLFLTFFNFFFYL